MFLCVKNGASEQDLYILNYTWVRASSYCYGLLVLARKMT